MQAHPVHPKILWMEHDIWPVQTLPGAYSKSFMYSFGNEEISQTKIAFNIM
jgi:hypothetical protein